MKPNKKLDREINEVLHVRGKQRRRKRVNMKQPDKKLDREIDAVLHEPGALPIHKVRAARVPTRKVALAQPSRPPTSTSDIRSPTSTSTEVRSPTSTSTEVRSPTSTSTDAYTSGNVTVTGGAGAGATTSVKIFTTPKTGKGEPRRSDTRANEYRSRGSERRMTDMIDATMAPRTPAPMPAIMSATGDRKTRSKRFRSDESAGSPWRQEPSVKTRAQLDAEIAESLASTRPGRRR